jgi:hypothetical protein
MNLFSNQTTYRAAAAIGFIAMAVCGWKTAEHSLTTSPRKTETPNSIQRPLRAVRDHGPPSAVRQRMASLKAIASPEERMRAAIDLALQLPTTDIASWMEGEWFQIGAGFDILLFKRILIDRWNKEDPEGLLIWRLKNRSGQSGIMMASWAEQEPDRVLSIFKDRLSKEQKQLSLAEIAKRNPRFALLCLPYLPSGNSDGFSMDLDALHNREILATLAKSSPAGLETSLDSLPEEMRRMAESALVAERLRSSFDSEFAKLVERPDGWKVFSECMSQWSDLKSTLINELAILPPAWKNQIATDPHRWIDSTNATHWWNANLEASGFTAEQAQAIRTQAVPVMGSENPAQALQLMDAAELDQDTRKVLIGNVFRNHKDKAEELIGLLRTEEDRNYARQWMNPTATSEGLAASIESPSDWLEHAIAPASPKSDPDLLLSTLRQWDAGKINEFGARFRELPDDQKTTAAEIITSSRYHFNQLDRSLVAEAMRQIIAHPFESDHIDPFETTPIHRASEFAVEWSRQDPEAASQWVQTLPPGETKLRVQMNLAMNWKPYDPDAVDHWLGTLPADSREKIEAFMKNGFHHDEVKPGG